MRWKASRFAIEPEVKVKGGHVALLRAPPGCDRSCQEASEQEGSEAGSIPMLPSVQGAPAGCEAVAWRCSATDPVPGK